jgi:hypothetical protein
MSDPHGQLSADYEQTTSLIATLTDVRFKLLAFVPTISGAAIAVLGNRRSTAELLAVGLLGLTATLGIVFYELRNTQLYDYAVHRAKKLEQRLQFVSISDETRAGGLFSERPDRTFRIFGLATVWHDRGLALVYGAAIGGWSYVVAWGALRALSVGPAQKVGGVIGVAVGLLTLAEFLRMDARPNKTGSTAARAPVAHD